MVLLPYWWYVVPSSSALATSLEGATHAAWLQVWGRPCQRKLLSLASTRGATQLPYRADRVDVLLGFLLELFNLSNSLTRGRRSLPLWLATHGGVDTHRPRHCLFLRLPCHRATRSVWWGVVRPMVCHTKAVGSLSRLILERSCGLCQKPTLLNSPQSPARWHTSLRGWTMWNGPPRAEQ